MAPEPFSITQANKLGTAEFIDAFGDVYDHASWIIERIAGCRPFTSRMELYLATAIEIDRASERERLALLTGHPELARPDLNNDTLTVDSTREQSGAGLLNMGNESKAHLNAIARKYTERHGFPGVVCVREHSGSESIIRELRRRVDRSTLREEKAAINEVKKIGWARIRDRVSAPTGHGGYLTTHALDTVKGQAANDLSFSLSIVKGGYPVPIRTACTNEDGRSDGAILSDGDFIPGVYEVTFRVGDYFIELNEADGRRYLDDVPIRVSIDDPSAHYHVPLILSRWGYTTYRGT